MSPRYAIPIAALCCGALAAQQPIGSVAMQDATVAGDLSVTGGRAVLVGASSVTAKDHTAEILLERGGTVLVCATSGLHITQSAAQGARPLMLALDRGAMEVHGLAMAGDVILTPDLRFAVQADGAIDMRIRVTRNGDTCVENRGPEAPVLGITDPFSDSIYELQRNQHVLFEHGSLKEVVDKESSPCGCPPAAAASGVSVAEALLAPGGGGAAAEHPFPAAVSQGLAPAAPVPQAAPGATHAQVSTTLGFSGDDTGSVDGSPPASTTPTAVVPPQMPAAPKPGFGHRLGRFFKRIFGG